MAFISIKIKEVSATCTATSGESNSLILLEGKMRWRSRINALDGRDLSKVPWSIQIVELDKIAEVAKSSHSVGVCGFSEKFDDPEHGTDEYFYAHVGLSRSDIELLYYAWVSKKQLKSITFDVPNLNYGWEPDGSGKIWDMSVNHLLIQSATISVKDYPEEEPLEDPFADPMQASPTRRDIASIKDQVASATTTVNYILVAVVMALVILLVR